MKRLFALLVSGIILTTAAFADDIISRNIKDLPAQARNVLNKHFPKKKVSYIKIDKELLKATTYDVYLENGTEVSFDSKGNWTEVDGNHNPVPAAFIPQKIKAAVQDMYPKSSIVKIEKDNRGWDVDLSNGKDIKFDKNFRIREVD